ncbi:hypothetical protein [Flavobacterium sp.]|uniref:hypothetical protein n=1 Tax=Flavobacterium sp. TaxID=239 RepID=UPI003A8E74C9
MKISIILLLLLAFSCSKPANEFDNKLIKRMTYEVVTTDVPSQFIGIDFYVKCENGDVAQVGVNLLRYIYKESKTEISYEEFLKRALNQEESFAESEYINCFSLDKRITEQYYSQGFKSLLDIYFEKSNNGLRLTKDLPENELKTLSYYCFLNNYMLDFDDYIGFYYIYKTSDLY